MYLINILSRSMACLFSDLIFLIISVMSSAPRKSRAPIKGSAGGGALSSRRAMTERRHQMAGSIRKARRSHAIALKRRCLAPALGHDGMPAGVEAGVGQLIDLASSFVQYASLGSADKATAADAAAALSALQSSLARSEQSAADSPLESLLQKKRQSLSPSSPSPALSLANALAQALASQDSMRLDAARILTNLAASGVGESTSAEENYYGDSEEDWCDVLVRSDACRTLIDIIKDAVHSGFSISAGTALSDLCEQCCWALGNIAGDSQRSRDALISAGAIGSLVTALKRAFGMARQSAQGAVHCGLCRNAAWALSNLARGASTSCLPFLHNALSSSDLADLIVAPEIFQSQTVHDGYSASNSYSSTWMDCSNEACWILAFLTAREDEGVSALLEGDSNVVNALARRLSSASDAIKSSNQSVAEDALRIAIPCIRSIGNIAAACGGIYIPNVLTVAGMNDVDPSSCGPLTNALATIIQVGTKRGRDFAAVACEACWAVGALLVDAGTPLPHPSTAACAVFIPTLCCAVSLASSKSELRREAVAGLCNAVLPPVIDGETPRNSASKSACMAVSDDLLSAIAASDGMINALASLLVSFDADTVVPSVTVVNAILRRLSEVQPSLKRQFEEADIVNALETVCDRASASSSYGQDKWRGNGSAQEKSAEIAADLIDDFFSDDFDAYEEMYQGTPAGASTFEFGSASFGPPPAAGYNFASPAGAGTASAQPRGMGRGRGRGRGSNLPAWMNQQLN